MRRRADLVEIPYPPDEAVPNAGADPAPIGAIVLGGDSQALGIVRSLGRRGIPVCVIDDERSISRFSQYTNLALRVPDLRDEQQIVETVLDVGRRFGLGGWVLYPTREEMVAALSRYRSVLAERFRVPTPEWTTIKWVWDKRNTYRLAADLGIPTPATWYPRSVREAAGIDVQFPVVVRPTSKDHFIYATKAKAWRSNTRRKLLEHFERAEGLMEPGEAMLQELIPGEGRRQFSYCAFFKDGRVIGSMMAQRRRQHPPEFGRASTYVATVELPQLEELSLRFLRAIDYYGLIELAYMLDPRDGQYKLLDVNARTWGYHTLGYRAGVDFPYLLFADQLGLPVKPVRARAGVNWIRLITDTPTAALQIWRGDLGWRKYFSSLRSAQVESVFCVEDLLPALVELALIPYLYFKRGV